MPMTKSGRVRVRNTEFYKEIQKCQIQLKEVKAHLLRLDYWQKEMIIILKQLEKDLLNERL